MKKIGKFASLYTQGWVNMGISFRVIVVSLALFASVGSVRAQGGLPPGSDGGPMEGFPSERALIPPAPGGNPELLPKVELRGPHKLVIRAFDRATGEPIKNFSVHGAIYVRLKDKTERMGQTLEWQFTRRMARLESQRATDGMVTYENLPTASFEFQFYATGYPLARQDVFLPLKSGRLDEIVASLSETDDVELPAELDAVNVYLNAGRKLQGRMVTKADHIPMPDFALSLPAYQSAPAMDGQAQSIMYHISTNTTTGLDGVFIFENLPPAQYMLQPRDLEVIFSNLAGMLDKREAMIPLDIVGEERRQAAAILEELVLSEAALIWPKLPSYDLTTTESLNAGDIELDRAPYVDLHVVDGDGNPVPHAAWSLSDGSARRCDIEGRAKIPIIGFQPGNVRQVQTAISAKYLLVREPGGKNMVSKIIEPKSGETISLTLTWKPDLKAHALHVRALDATTDEPIPEYKVILGDADFVDSFMRDPEKRREGIRSSMAHYIVAMCSSEDGRTAVRGIRLSEEDPLPPMGGSRSVKYPDSSKLRLLVVAPGYARKMVKPPVDTITSGGEITFKLEPEAVLTGRFVVRGASDGPLTPMLLAEIRAAKGLPPKKPVPDPSIVVGTFDKATNRMGPSDQESLWATSSLALLDSNGEFRFEGLPPKGDWTLEVNPDGIPGFQLKHVPLRAGVVDLGTMTLGDAGKLSGFVLGENDEPIPGPLQIRARIGRLSFDTSPDGSFETSLDPLSDDEQLVRIVPPWAMEPGAIEPPAEPRIYFDHPLHIDRFGDNAWNPHLPKGGTLRLSIKVSEEAARRAADEAGRKPFYRAKTDSQEPVTPSAASPRIVTIALQRLDPPPNEPTYHQQIVLPDGGLELKAGTHEVELRDVPAGNMAVIVTGDFAPADSSAPPLDPAQYIQISKTQVLACSEFVMDARDSEHTIELPANELTFEFEKSADAEARGEQPGGTGGVTQIKGRTGPDLFTLEREGPESFSLGSPLRRAALDSKWYTGRGVADLRLSIIGIDGSLNAVHRTPTRLQILPPGRYTLRMWHGIEDLAAANPQPFFTTTVEIPAADSVVKVTVPSVDP